MITGRFDIDPVPDNPSRVMVSGTAEAPIDRICTAVAAAGRPRAESAC